MSRPKPVCRSIEQWLEANLGKRCFAPITSVDSAALAVCVHIVDLYSHDRSDETAKAFGLVASRMQPHTQYLAFHAIAHVMDWSHRYELWDHAGLELPAHLPRCEHEPKGEINEQKV